MVYTNTFESNLKPLNVVFNSLCRFILNFPFKTRHCFMYDSLNWLEPKPRRDYHWILFIFKCVYSNSPTYLKHHLIPYSSTYSLRHLQCPTFFKLPRLLSVAGRKAFQYKAPHDWNNLPNFFFFVGLFLHLVYSNHNFIIS